MKKIIDRSILMLSLFVITALSSCRAIAGIFKAGVWFGVIGVVVVVVIIIWIISRVGKSK